MTSIITRPSNVIIPEVMDPIKTDYAHHGVSDRYNHVTTIDVVNSLRDSGWDVTKTATARTRIEDRRGFQKHFVWMHHSKKKMTVGDCEMRILLVNSHDGTSSLQIAAALYRLVCSNGMVVDQGQFAAIRIRHSQEDILQRTMEGANHIAALAPAIDANIKTMQSIELSPEQQALFAQQTSKLVWPDKSEDWLDPNLLLNARRGADVGNDLWRVYNRVQENVMRGGLEVNSASRFKHTRSINSMIRDVEVNRDLFALATTFAK